MAQFAPTGGSPAPATTLSPILVSSPSIITTDLVTAGNEVEITIPASTKWYRVRARDSSKLQFGYNVGDSSTNYYSINPGSTYSTPDTASLNLTGNLVIYIQSTKDGTVVEVEAWT